MVEVINTLQVSRTTDRNIYRYGNTYLYEDVHFPWNPFKPSTSELRVDIPIREGTHVEGGVVDTEWGYNAEGFGLPTFTGDETNDPMDLAITWINQYRNQP